MDISDILQGLGSRPADRDPFAEDYDDLFSAGTGQQSGQADLQALTRAWVNERGAAELLPYFPSPLSETPSNTLQLAQRRPDRTLHKPYKATNRARRTHDRRHGPKNKLLSHHNSNRSRAVEISHPVLPPRSNLQDR